MVRILGVFSILVLILSGCSQTKETGCGAPAAKTALTQFLHKRIEKDTKQAIKDTGESKGYDAAKLRSTIKSVKFSFDEVRTVSKAEDSTRQFCAAKAKITIPTKLLDEVNAILELAEQPGVGALATDHDLSKEVNTYFYELEYSVQPTDDGSKIVAETDTESSLLEFFTAIFGVYAMSDEIKQLSLEEKREEMAEERVQKQAEREQQAMKNEEQQALNEQAAAILSEAKVNNDLAVERLNAVWSALGKEGRTAFLEQQRAWLKRVTADCKVEAAGSSPTKSVREANRLNCEAKAQWARANYLESYIGYWDGDATAAAAGAAAAAAEDY